MLDPRAPARRAAPQGLEGVERAAHRAIADGVQADVETGGRTALDDVDELLLPGDSDAAAVEHLSGTTAQ